MTLQGTWISQGTGATNSTSLLFRGANVEVDGPNAKLFYKATFSLREDTNPKQLVAVITECTISQWVGKTINAIYQIQDGTLTITANGVGNAAVPASFDAPGAPKTIYKHK